MRCISMFLLACTIAGPVSGQVTDTARTATDSLPPAPFFTHKDLYVAAAFTAAAIAATQLDTRLANELQTSRSSETKFVNKTASFFRFMGQPAPQLIGGGLLVGGRLFGKDRAADLGLHGLESMFMAQSITNVIKRVAGRARPYVHGDSSSTDFKLFRGFRGRDYQSFPSGHSTTAFAAAAATTAESEHFWKGHQILVGTVLFGGATMVGVSRMYHNDHWASDVAVAAMIGTFSGFKVVKYNHDHPNNRLNRALLGLDVAPSADGGVVVGGTVRFGAPASARQ